MPKARKLLDSSTLSENPDHFNRVPDLKVEGWRRPKVDGEAQK